MVLLGGGAGSIRFLSRRRGFRCVVQVQQVFQEGNIGRVHFRKPHEEVFPCEQDSFQDAEILPVLVQARCIPAVGVVMTVQEINGKQHVQFSTGQNLRLVRG